MSEEEKRAAQMAFIDTETNSMNDFYRQLIRKEYLAEHDATLARHELTQEIAQGKYPEIEIPQIEQERELGFEPER